MKCLLIVAALLLVSCAEAPVNAPDSGKYGKPEKYLHFQLLCLEHPDLPGCGNGEDDQ